MQKALIALNNIISNYQSKIEHKMRSNAINWWLKDTKAIKIQARLRRFIV